MEDNQSSTQQLNKIKNKVKSNDTGTIINQRKAELEKYELESKRKETARRDKIRDHLGWGAIAGLWIFFLLSIIFISCWAWHIVSPDSLHFLTDKQINNIQSIILSAFITKNIGKYAKKYF